ncbi:uncharacterized protein DUF4336 [Litoreibacter ponti]|uniref:Uncharacterized protein DUF4336 n=1 Tax=Litoreibacter ponti TaxID=1510457 RepID=A0A2T6BKD4_9RHOB|nr:DUF4336 domain-containing protein [Litoreibacter ponti]PTX56515.1 uncharacterized protein DUF4336 [Litoreibacter ponti]
MLIPIGPKIWICDGPDIVAAAGFHYPTRMVVIALKSGLFVWSPIAPTSGLLEAMRELGDVRYLIAPNHLHHMAMPAWARAFPEAAVYGAPGVGAKRPELDITEMTDRPGPWQSDLAQVLLPNRISDEIAFFHRESGTVLICDLLQQMPKGWFSGWRALVARLDLMTADAPQVPRKFRLALGRGVVIREAVGRMLDWPAERVVMAHGPVIERDGQAFLKRSFKWLTG